MKVLSVTCSQCSGPLEVRPGPRAVQCAYCGSQLRVEGAGAAAHTTLVDGRPLAAGQVDGERRDLIDRLDLLDREWRLSRDEFAVTDKHGRTSVPSVAGVATVGALSGVVAVFWIVTAMRIGAPFVFPLFGVAFLGLIAFKVASMMRAATRYQHARGDFERRRRELVQQLGIGRGG